METWLGIIIALIAASLWGTASGFEKRYVGVVGEMPFMTITQLSQFGLTLVVTFAQYDQLQTEFAMSKALALFFAGSAIVIGKTFYVCAVRHISSFTAIVMANLFADLFVSVIIQQFIPSDNVHIQYLPVASFLYFVGLFLFTKAEFMFENQCLEENVENERILKRHRKRKLRHQRFDNIDEMIGTMLVEEGNDFSPQNIHIDVENHTFRIDSVVANNRQFNGDLYESTSIYRSRDVFNEDIDHIIYGFPDIKIDESTRLEKSTDIATIDGSPNVVLIDEPHDSYKIINISTIASFQEIYTKFMNSSFAERISSRRISQRSSKRSTESLQIIGTHRTITRGETKIIIDIKMMEEAGSPTLGVILGLTAGVAYGLFYILSAIGANGEGAITQWSTAFFIQQIGMITTLPVILFFFGHWDPFKLFPEEERITSIKQLFHMGRREMLASIFLGFVDTTVYSLIYLAASALPFSILGGIMSSETMVGFMMSYFVWKEFRDPPLCCPLSHYIFTGTVIYIGALFVLTFLASQ